MSGRLEAIISYDLSGMVIGWSPGATRLFGYSSTDMMGAYVTRIIPMDEQAAAEEQRRAVAGGEPSGRLVTTRLSRDGSVIPVEITLSVLTDPDGGTVAFCELIGSVAAPEEPPAPDEAGGRVRNIGYHGRPGLYLEAELYQRVRDDPAIFDFLQDGSLDGLWYWDLDNPEHEWLSPRLKECFGYADEDIPNTSAWWQANIFPEDLTIALDNYTQHLSDPHHRYDQIVRYRHRDGSTVWVRCRGIAIRDATGRPIRMLGAHTDVTPIKKVEEALADRAAALEAANAELAAGNMLKAELAGVLSHAINQPLCVITNYCDLLVRKWDRMPDERRQAWVHSLDDAARELSRLIADLMLMFRLDVSVVTVSHAAVDVRTALDEALEWLPGDVRVDRYVDDGLAVLCDRGHFRHVLINLLTNAVKYGREPIEVHGRVVDGSGQIMVRDHGDGVPAEFAPRLFDRFSRADGAAGLGAGLGLFIVDQLLGANGGAAGYQPTPSGGAGIVLELELAEPAAGSSPDAAVLVTARGAVSDR